MVEIKVKKKVDRTILSHKFKSGEQISSNELEVLQKKSLDFIPSAKITESLFGKSLVYETPNSLELSRYLQQNISFDEFGQILTQLVETLLECTSYGLRSSNFEKNPDYIFVDLSSRKVKILYWPMFYLKDTVADRAFLELIVTSYICDTSSSDITKKKELIDFLSSTSDFSLSEFARFVKELMGRTKIVDEIETEYHGVIIPPKQEDDEPPTEGIWTPCLIHVSSGNKKIPINHFPFVLGRSSKCDYTIPENIRISRQHAEIRKENGVVSICDIEDKNGVKVNGTIIPRMVNFSLNTGDKILLDKEEFVFYASFVQ